MKDEIDEESQKEKDVKLWFWFTESIFLFIWKTYCDVYVDLLITGIDFFN